MQTGFVFYGTDLNYIGQQLNICCNGDLLFSTQNSYADIYIKKITVGYRELLHQPQLDVNGAKHLLEL
jgi:hypothetical protein